MMNKYLEKIAKEFLVQSQEDNPDPYNKLTAGAVGAITAGIAHSKVAPTLSGFLVGDLMHAEPGENEEVLKKTLKEVLPRTNTTLDVHEATPNRFLGDTVKTMMGDEPVYVPESTISGIGSKIHKIGRFMNAIGKPLGVDPQYKDELLDNRATKNYINMGNTRNTDILFHELGHAEDFATGPVKLKKALMPVGRMGGLAFTAAGGAMLTNEKTRDYAWAAPIVGSLPTLREEYSASKRGYDMIKRHGGVGKKYIPAMARAFGTYMMKPGLAAATLAGINYARRKGEEVDPDEWLKGRE